MNSLTFPLDVSRDLLVHVVFDGVWIRVDVVFAHGRETGRVHPTFHDKGPADEAEGWTEETGDCG